MAVGGEQTDSSEVDAGHHISPDDWDSSEMASLPSCSTPNPSSTQSQGIFIKYAPNHVFPLLKTVSWLPYRIKSKILNEAQEVLQIWPLPISPVSS